MPAVAARTLIAPAVVGACGCRVFMCAGACLQVLGLVATGRRALMGVAAVGTRFDATLLDWQHYRPLVQLK